ncbi:DUF4007 family protein [PVC group bacterium]|nr:DUF4007 family protein [PVC group bacterium]
MRFGGHETFVIREGWFAKIIHALDDCPDIFMHEFPEDYLGVGRNMAKSMRHWMVATGIALRDGAGKNISGYSLSPFGRLILEHDPDLLTKTVWQLIHINLVNTPEHAASWSWFFNHWTQQKFTRNICVQSLKRHLELTSKRVPKLRTLERDIACMLASYAEPIPRVIDDPEDANECPLRELSMMQYFKGTGTYSITRDVKDLSAPVLLYAINEAYDAEELETKSIDCSIQSLERMPGGPGRCFMMSAESIFELTQLHTVKKTNPYSVINQAGEKVISFKSRDQNYWAKKAMKLEGSNVSI